MAPEPDPEPTPEPKLVGVYEFTVSGIASGEMTASAVRIDDSGEPVTLGTASGALNAVGDTLAIEFFQHGRVAFERRQIQNGNGHRYIWVSYRVRNATGAPLTNLTFIAAAAGWKYGDTPFSGLRKIDGSFADSTIANTIVPTGYSILGDGLRLKSPVPGILQVFDESEVASLPRPTGVRQLFPFGFVTGNVANPVSRVIPAATNAQQWDGVVHFAFRVPLQGTLSDDVDAFSIRTVAFQDTETRLTESIEEGQDTAAVRRLRERATAMGATTVTVLAGSPASSPSIPDYPGQRQICSVRTAGTAADPLSLITRPGPLADFMVLKPGETMDPCAAGFRTGTPGRPATNVPMQVWVRAVDLYGNMIPVRDTVYLEMDPASPPVEVTGPVGLNVNGAASIWMKFADYGNAVATIRGRRLLGTPNPIAIFGVTRTWTAGAGTNDWHAGANWNGGGAPMHLDSVFVPAAAPLYPQLAANVQIEGVTVENGATVSLGGFNLTAAANVATGTSGGINSSVGRLMLTGVGRTVRGNLPRMRVTGSYSLDGNVTTVAPLRVEAGRLRNASYRVRAVSQ